MKRFVILLTLCCLAVPLVAQESLPTIRILPEDVVQTSIEQSRSPLGTNKFSISWKYTEAGARKVLAFRRAHPGEKVLEQVGDFEFEVTIFTGKPPNGTEEDWLKTRTDKFFAVGEEDAKKIVAGMKGK